MGAIGIFAEDGQTRSLIHEPIIVKPFSGSINEMRILIGAVYDSVCQNALCLWVSAPALAAGEGVR